MNEPLINPYDTRGMVRESRQFFGRTRELRETFGRLATMQSVSVVGERRIGKSSFLHRLTQPQEGELSEAVIIKSLDLQRVFSVEEFYQRACNLLNREDGKTHLDFEEALRGKRVVLCLDEFEQAYHKDFGDEFFNALRSYAQEGNLALVVATQTPLNQLHTLYLQDEDVTSKFHNIFAQLPLGELTVDEARELVATPRNGLAFAPAEIERILALGGRKPYQLNLACAEVYAAKQNGALDYEAIKQRLNESPASQPATAADVAAVNLPVASVTKPVEGDPNVSVRWALWMMLAGAALGSLSANAGFGPGMFAAMLLLTGSLWLLYKSFAWRGGTQ